MDNNIIYALILTTIAGISTVIGGFFTFFIKRDNLKFLSAGLGFSAGVMIFLSLFEILPDAKEMLEVTFPDKGELYTFICFFIGIFIAVLIDYFIPDHIEGDLFSDEEHCNKHHRIKRAGIFTAIAICIHNFPEGIANFMISSESLRIGIPMVIAIAIHNIPEGIAVALPLYHATGKKRVAIGYSFLSGMSEPLGAIIAFILMQTFLPNLQVGYMFAAVSGIMLYISIDTLLPLAREYGDNHHVVRGIFAGVFFIALTLLLF